MNLTNFLKQTDVLTSQYSTEQLSAFIHNIGRVLPEHLREDFLKRLKSAGETTEKTENKNEENDTKFQEMYTLARNNLKIIDSQEVMIDSIYNQEYDEWYNNSVDEFYYEDNSGISDMLATACDFVHTCMDIERYKEGFEVGNQLFSMEILCDSEYGDEELSLGDMVYHKLLYCNLKQGIALYLLYLHEGQWSGKGITAMSDMVKNEMKFSVEEYRKGICGFDDIEENELFRQLFFKWKSVVQMAPDIRESAIKKITNLLEKRIKGIMEANRRNYYNECAAYIAALGEVRESLGERDAKQRLMTLYKDKYPQRRAFREEMRRYGWIDVKRKKK